MLKGVTRKRLLEFVLVIFPCYMAMQVALSRRVHKVLACTACEKGGNGCGLVGVSEWDLVRCAPSGHYRRVRWEGLCLSGALDLICIKHHFRRG